MIFLKLNCNATVEQSNVDMKNDIDLCFMISSFERLIKVTCFLSLYRQSLMQNLKMKIFRKRR